MTTVIRCGALCNNYFLEANDFQSYCVLSQPGTDPESPSIAIRAGWLGCLWAAGFGAVKRIMIDYIAAFKTARQRHLGIDPHYFIFSCGTDVQHRRKGLMVALLKECVKIAQKTGEPIWSEATTKGSCDAHVKAGFKKVEEVVLAPGAINEHGEIEKGGAGVRMYCLVWRPE